MKTIRCCIVEDNEIDQLMLTHFVKQFPFLDLVGVFSSAEAFSSKEENVDLLFLDVDLPGSSGIELRKMMMHIPACIFVSSHPEFALESFEVDALDFISKPLKKERFESSMNRLTDYFRMREKSQHYDVMMGNRILHIKEGHDVVQLDIEEIKYLEALKDYTRLITQAKKYYVLKSIGNLLQDKNFDNFIRIHKSYAVPKHLITKKSSTEITLENQKNLPVGRAYKENLSFFDV